MINIREEVMSPAMTKFHLLDLPFGAVAHRFTEPDLGDPHDHPWGFYSFIMHGGYTEETFDHHGRNRTVHHYVGDSFFVSRRHIHRIVELHDGECWTMILPMPLHGTQKSGFWQFREGKAFHRFWDQIDWTEKWALAR